MSHAPTRSSRFEARISPDQQALIKLAADIEGRTLTDFGLKAMMDAARQIIEQHSIIKLVKEDQELFARALAEPPAPTPALERAASRRIALLQDV